jgi:hypothetical protein
MIAQSNAGLDMSSSRGKDYPRDERNSAAVVAVLVAALAAFCGAVLLTMRAARRHIALRKDAVQDARALAQRLCPAPRAVAQSRF